MKNGNEPKPKKLANELSSYLAAAHAPVKGTHSHAHPAYRSQGGDQSHDHMHSHDGDAHHGHDHGMNVPARPEVASMSAGMLSFVAAAHATVENKEDPRERFLATLTASGARYGVQQSGEEWTLFDAKGDAQANFGSYHDATFAIYEQLAQGAERPVLAETWRSEMTYEGVDTGDGRFIAVGAVRFRDCPMPLMLQTETEIGHFGAVLAGTIEQTGMVGQTAVGTGSFDDSEAGRQFLDIINARGRFGVSVDIGESEADFECTERDPEYDECVDGRLTFTLAEVMGLTGTPFPAFADAFIEVAANGAQPVAASGQPDGERCVECEEEAAAAGRSPLDTSPLGKEDGTPLGKEDPGGFVAAAAPVAPPTEWFENPGFHVGDSRLTKQPNGGAACPLTVTADGRVFGHIASFKSCHTSYADRCVPPPRSPSEYAYFTTGAVTTAEGKTVRVGQLTMGAGHASTDPRTSLSDVRAHYDGGPGAVQMADVTVGEDDFGIWFAGALRPEVTDEQVRAFTSCGVSGDWREVVRGKGLDLVACAAGIPVPGFPIARAIAAAGIPESIHLELPDTRARFLDGQPIALVAAGVVRQPLPWERMIAAQQAEIETLKARVSKTERVTAPLRSKAAEQLVAALAPSEE